jgi:hypothetical protein
LAAGKTVALVGDELRLMDVETGAVRFCVPGLADNLLAVSADDRLLAARRASGVGIWEAATGKEVASAAVGAAAHIGLTPDGRFLVSTDESTLRVWNLAAGKESRRWSLPLTGIDAWGHTFVTRLVLTADGRRAVTALADGTALVWDLTPALAAAAPPAPDEIEVARWWKDLAGDDAGKAYAAVWRLTEAPSTALPLFRRHLRPVTDADLAEARRADLAEAHRLIAQLNDDTFAVREKASRRLEELGAAAMPVLRQAVTKDPPLEVRRRIAALLDKQGITPASGAYLRLLRALAVLEHAGTPEARRLLEELAAGAPDAPPTQEARAVLARLGRRGR